MVTAVKDPVTGAVTLKTVDTRERDIDLAAKSYLANKGVLKAAAQWDIELAIGERVFGMPKIVGNDIVVNTSLGGFSGDISDTLLDKGNTYRITDKGLGTSLRADEKAFGGALIMDGQIVVTSAAGMNKITPADAVKGATATNPRNRYTPTDYTTWEQLPMSPLK